MRRYPRLLLLVTHVLLCTTACSSGDRTADGGATSPAAADVDSSVAAARDPATAADSALQSAAERIVAFLQGAAAYDTASVADTVTLLTPAEGGGARQRMSRDELRDRRAWVVRTDGREYSLVPPANLTQRRVAPGRHYNCHEGPLAARVPELAAAPHVGVRLEPPGATSCLQGWNATFVFDTAAQPRLTAVIYDQWEW